MGCVILGVIALVAIAGAVVTALIGTGLSLLLVRPQGRPPVG